MPQELIFDDNTTVQKNLVWWLYVGHGICLAFTLGMASFIPLILNYVKRPEAAGTFVYSHHSWQIRSFWWYVVWVCFGGVLFITVVGAPLAWFVVWPAAWIWKAYRLIRGIIDLNANKPMPV